MKLPLKVGLLHGRRFEDRPQPGSILVGSGERLAQLSLILVGSAQRGMKVLAAHRSRTVRLPSLNIFGPDLRRPAYYRQSRSGRSAR
jgi:hypothetical protein